MSLATKWRPSSFNEVTEQSTVINIISKLCTQDNLDNRNFLFIGPAGTGKTTTARIMANVLNHGQGDTIEIDAASHNGVDSVKEIINQARQYPVIGKYKVFVIDECFTGSTLIRTLEGLKPISSIAPCDRVLNLTGEATVKNLFKNRVKKSNLVLLSVSGQPILTTRNHLFFTDDGWVTAENLKQGEYLYDYQTMRNLRKYVPIIRERSSSSLQQGVWGDTSKTESCFEDVTEATSWLHKNVSCVWENLLHTTEHKFIDLFSEVRCRIQEATRTFTETERCICYLQAGIYLSGLREAYDDSEVRLEENLQRCLRNYLSESSTDERKRRAASEILCSMWKSIHSQVPVDTDMFRCLQIYFSYTEAEGKKISRVIYQNESKQPYDESGDCREDEVYEIAERYFAQSSCESWRKRSIYQSSDSFERLPWIELGPRVSCTYKGRKNQSEQLSYELQTRPRLSRIEVGSRGGWQRPQYEISQIVRCKESGMPRKSRVDSITFYERGNNDELFSSYFSDSELDSETVCMYDLEVDGHPSYYANDILVHNCHTFSPQAWQMFLKTLEDSPAKSIFIFCTTNPEKIPATIISRVQTFQLSKISLKGIFDRLCFIINEENKEGAGITYTDDAVNFIGKMANGGMRDAITLLDKTLAFTHDLTSESVATALNLPDYDDYFKLLQAYSKKDNRTISDIINTVYNSGVNFIKWFEGFHSFVMNVVKYIFLQDINLTMIPSHYQEKISKYGPAHSIVCLNIANKLLKLNHELKTTQYLQEVALTYLCQIPKKEG